MHEKLILLVNSDFFIKKCPFLGKFTRYDLNLCGMYKVNNISNFFSTRVTNR